MKKLLCLLLAGVMALMLVSCEVKCNFITTGYLQSAEVDGLLYFQSQYAEDYQIDLKNKTFSRVESDDSVLPSYEGDDLLAYKMFAGEYGSTIPTGYEAIAEQIEACELDNGSSVVDAYGSVQEGILTGFVRVYKDMRTIYGNYAIEEIDHSILFSYNADSDAFSIIKRLEKVVVVAFSKDTVIYWKNKAYYAYDLKTDAERYLVEDKAYDSGMNQQSSPCVFSNETMCVFHLVKGELSKDKEYMYVFDFEGGEFFELKIAESNG